MNFTQMHVAQMSSPGKPRHPFTEGPVEIAAVFRCQQRIVPGVEHPQPGDLPQTFECTHIPSGVELSQSFPGKLRCHKFTGVFPESHLVDLKVESVAFPPAVRCFQRCFDAFTPIPCPSSLETTNLSLYA